MMPYRTPVDYSNKALLAATAVAVAGAVLRALAVPPLIADLDGVNFAQGLEQFDLLKQSPHFPGYPVFLAAAKLVRWAGVGHEVWALCLPGILLWPPAGLLFFIGARRVGGSWPALGVLVVGSIAPAAVLAGAWPASDGLGLALLFAALGCFGLATGAQGSRRSTLLALGGLLLGLTLGVRLSWLPLLLGLGALALLRLPWRLRARLALAALAGVGLWLVPLAAMVGPAELVQLGLGFTHGHVAEWGGTALATQADLWQRGARAAWTLWAAGLGALWPLGVPMTELAAAKGALGFAAELAVAGLLVTGGLLAARRWRRAGAQRVVLLALLLAVPYLAWVLALQNVAKVRHLVPLLPLLGAVVFFGFGQHARGRLLAAALSVLLLGISSARALDQHGRATPGAAAVRWTSGARAPTGLQIFAGEETRLFHYHLPAYRVARAASARVLADEAARLTGLGVEVWISSQAPGVDQLRQRLTPLATFSFPVELRPHDARLTLYRYRAPAAPRALAARAQGERR